MVEHELPKLATRVRFPSPARYEVHRNRLLKVFADPERAGRSATTLGVDDLDAHVASLAEQGIELSRQTTSRGQPLASVTDPDGNLVVLAEGL